MRCLPQAAVPHRGQRTSDGKAWGDVEQKQHRPRPVRSGLPEHLAFDLPRATLCEESQSLAEPRQPKGRPCLEMSVGRQSYGNKARAQIGGNGVNHFYNVYLPHYAYM